jgi:hypothetical protein
VDVSAAEMPEARHTEPVLAAHVEVSSSCTPFSHLLDDFPHKGLVIARNELNRTNLNLNRTELRNGNTSNQKHKVAALNEVPLCVLTIPVTPFACKVFCQFGPKNHLFDINKI